MANRKNFNFELRKKSLIEVKKILDDNNLTFWLADGALLGAYRERDFIKWDNEVDLDCFDEFLKPRYNLLSKTFAKINFNIEGHYLGKGSKINLYKGGEKISIRGLYLDSNYCNNKFRLSKLYRYPKKFYKKLGILKFKGESFNTPSPIEKYLEYVYGKHWRIPIKSKKKLIRLWLEMGVRRRVGSKDKDKNE